MTDPDIIRDEDLHAYIDGQLPPDRMDAVEDYLAQHPEAAARMADYARMNDDLHNAFPLEDTPPRLTATLHPPRRWQMPHLANIAAGLILLAGGVGIGWAMKPAPAMQPVAGNAITAHATFVTEVLHPVEVTSEQQDHLVGWLSKRLGADIKAPDLAAKGFTLLGGRLLPSDTGPAAQFMYENAAGRRVTLYATDSGENPETSFKFTTGDGFEAFYWQDNDIAYALVGDLSKEDLRTLAIAVYSQLI